MDRELLARTTADDAQVLEPDEVDALKAAVGVISYEGVVPDVAEWTPRDERPTASELAFGETAPTAQGQASSNAPEQRQSAQPAPYVPPERAVEKPLPQGAKFDPKFVSLALGKVAKAGGPKSVRLPPDVAKALDVAWERTKRDGKEHGGNLVRTYGGNFEVRHGGGSGQYDDEWSPDYNDTGFAGNFLGIVHTHPYDLKKEGLDHGSFSGDDLANLCDHDGRMSFVRSAQYTYMVVKTKEFDRKLLAEVESERDNRELVYKREEFKAQMKRCFEAAYSSHRGSESAKIEAGVLAVCDKYHLLYYTGQGAQLTRNTR